MAVLGRIDSMGKTDVLSQGTIRPPRYPVDMTGRLRIGANLFIVRVLDISCGGAKLLLTERGQHDVLKRGAVVLMNAGCLPVPKLADVTWLRGDQLGLSFHDPLAASDLQALARKAG